MVPERTFRNSLALSFLLLGLALVFFSLGGFAQFVSDLVAGAYADLAADGFAIRALLVLISVAYFVIGIALVRSRPQPWRERPDRIEPVHVSAVGVLVALRLLSVVVTLLGLLFLFDAGPVGRDASLAAVLLLAGVFAFLATTLYHRVDVNVRATGAIVGVIAAALILYAQLQLAYSAPRPGNYGPWEVTNLVVPRVLGPVAAMLVGLGALAYVYVWHPRAIYAVFLALGLAALVYGIGVTLAGLTAFFETPWGDIVGSGGLELALFLSLTAGIVLLTAGGATTIVASLVSLVRSGQGLSRSGPEAETVAPAPPIATRRVEAVPPAKG